MVVPVDEVVDFKDPARLLPPETPLGHARAAFRRLGAGARALAWAGAACDTAARAMFVLRRRRW